MNISTRSGIAAGISAAIVALIGVAGATAAVRSTPECGKVPYKVYTAWSGKHRHATNAQRIAETSLIAKEYKCFFAG